MDYCLLIGEAVFFHDLLNLQTFASGLLFEILVQIHETSTNSDEQVCVFHLEMPRLCSNKIHLYIYFDHRNQKFKDFFELLCGKQIDVALKGKLFRLLLVFRFLRYTKAIFLNQFSFLKFLLLMCSSKGSFLLLDKLIEHVFESSINLIILLILLLLTCKAKSILELFAD